MEGDGCSSMPQTPVSQCTDEENHINCGLRLTPTDVQQQKRPLNSQDQPNRRRSLNRKPFLHPTQYRKSINSVPIRDSVAVDENNGSHVSQSSGSLNAEYDYNSTATFIRQKYYSRLTDLNDDRMRVPDHVLPSSLFYPIPSAPEEKQNSIVTIFAIWNTMMGTSLLSMPWGIGQSGFIFGIIIIVSSGLLTFYTAYRVVKSKQYIDRYVFEFSDVVSYYFGPSGEWIAVIFGLLAFLGGMIVYWVLMTNFLFMTGMFIRDKVNHFTPTNVSDVVCANALPVHNKSGLLDFDIYDVGANDTIIDKIWNETRTVPVYLIIIIFPLLNFKSPTFFTKFNCLGTLSVIYLWVLIIAKMATWGINMELSMTDFSKFSVTGFHTTFPALTGMLSLAFFLHNAVISILRNNKHEENNIRDLSIGYLLVTITYMFVGVLFYASFPMPKNCISSNLLANLATGDPLAAGARIFLLFQMITVFPLLAYMFRIQILHTACGNIWPGLPHIIFLNALLVALCVLVAMFYPHIGDIIRYSGSLCGLVYVFVLPVIVHMLALHRRGEMRPISFIAHSFIIVLGLANFVAQFLITPSK